mmetsp:Transcript_103309/g.194359  ORF Transcript_103309/g.194359 Transcript_103309/m.194359 type:complete len:202 (+) Transcript_103309:63-668(+)
MVSRDPWGLEVSLPAAPLSARGSARRPLRPAWHSPRGACMPAPQQWSDVVVPKRETFCFEAPSRWELTNCLFPSRLTGFERSQQSFAIEETGRGEGSARMPWGRPSKGALESSWWVFDAVQKASDGGPGPGAYHHSSISDNPCVCDFGRSVVTRHLEDFWARDRGPVRPRLSPRPGSAPASRQCTPRGYAARDGQVVRRLK